MSTKSAVGGKIFQVSAAAWPWAGETIKHRRERTVGQKLRKRVALLRRASRRLLDVRSLVMRGQERGGLKVYSPASGHGVAHPAPHVAAARRTPAL